MSGFETGDYWPYIWASYALTFSAIASLAILTVHRLRHWAKKAQAITAERAAKSEEGAA